MLFAHDLMKRGLWHFRRACSTLHAPPPLRNCIRTCGNPIVEKWTKAVCELLALAGACVFP
jgi:hypothetical protein